MKPINYLLLVLLVTSSCKDKLYKECCSGSGQVEGPHFAPNAYTPNGDGLNDVFMIIEQRFDSSLNKAGIKYVYNFKVKQKGKELYSMDTVVSIPGNKNKTWDFIDKNGNRVSGDIMLSYTIMDTDNKVYNNDYETCSIVREDVEEGKVELTHATCRLTDMIDPFKGFIYPTSDPFCP